MESSRVQDRALCDCNSVIPYNKHPHRDTQMSGTALDQSRRALDRLIRSGHCE